MDERKNSEGKRRLYITIGVLFFASLIFRLIDDYRFEQSSILFIGLPALMALLIVKYTNTPNNLYAMVFRVITLFLLISGIILGEGMICIIIAAPIFYGVAALIVAIYNYLRKNNNLKLFSIIIFPLLILIAQPYDVFKDSTVHTVDSVALIDVNDGINNLRANPEMMFKLPKFFKIGFPKPVEITGTDLDIGARRNIEFESSTKGIGVLSLELVEKTESYLVFKPVSDQTHINHWLTWEEVKIETFDQGAQKYVKWTTSYRCDLGPSWYFEPIERLAVTIMNRHLINVYFNA